MQSRKFQIKTVRSTTSRGSCEISVLDWNADLDVSKQQIESRINQIRTDFCGIQITVEKMNPSIFPYWKARIDRLLN
jgi:multidrug efflux pump subunit AcrB